MVDCLIKADISAMNLASTSTKSSNNNSGSFENLINAIKGEIKPDPVAYEITSNMIKLGMPSNSEELPIDFLVGKSTEQPSTDAENTLENMDYSVVSGYVSQVMDLLQENFSLTENELNQLLEEAGLEKTDLLTNSGITSILTKLSPEENVLNLLTNSDSSKIVKELLSLVNDAKEMLTPDLNLEDKEFARFLQELTKDNSLKQNTEHKQTEVQGLTSQEIIPEEITDSSTNRLQDENSKVAMDIPVVEKVVETEVQTESKNNEQRSNQQSTLENFTQVVSDKLSEIVKDNFEPIDVQRIVKQIIEEIKVSVKQDLSKMEMQLYPEHLGKIGLEIVSKEGSVSAHLIASNAVVKEALEANISMLRTNMENQGIKVDSIEVTVASHELEQQFNQNNEKEDRQSSKRNRFMNMQALDTSDEMNTMDELLEEQRKKLDGHSVSFKA